MEISKAEFQATIVKKRRDTATGIENISYSMIQHLPVIMET